MFIPDTHMPFHNRKAWALTQRAARVWEPDILVVLGDFGDWYSLSFFDKSPERKETLASELAAVNIGLDELDSLGAKEKHFVFGNHEHRLDRYIANKAPELAGLISLENSLRLAKRGWRVTPYKRSLQVGKLRITHDRGNAGKRAHIQARDRYGSNAVIAHTHHMGLDYQGNAMGEMHVGAVFGWLGDVEAVDYTHYDNALTWPLGFGVGLMDNSTGAVHLQACPIVRGKVAVGSELVA